MNAADTAVRHGIRTGEWPTFTGHNDSWAICAAVLPLVYAQGYGKQANALVDEIENAYNSEFPDGVQRKRMELAAAELYALAARRHGSLFTEALHLALCLSQDDRASLCSIIKSCEIPELKDPVEVVFELPP